MTRIFRNERVGSNNSRDYARDNQDISRYLIFETLGFGGIDVNIADSKDGALYEPNAAPPAPHITFNFFFGKLLSIIHR